MILQPKYWLDYGEKNTLVTQAAELTGADEALEQTGELTIDYSGKCSLEVKIKAMVIVNRTPDLKLEPMDGGKRIDRADAYAALRALVNPARYGSLESVFNSRFPTGEKEVNLAKLQTLALQIDTSKWYLF